MDESLGPSDIFTGVMGAPVTRNVKTIKVIAAATFTVLDLMYPANTAGAATPQSVANYPVLSEIQYVKKFQLSGGTIQVIYYA